MESPDPYLLQIWNNFSNFARLDIYVVVTFQWLIRWFDCMVFFHRQQMEASNRLHQSTEEPLLRAIFSDSFEQLQRRHFHRRCVFERLCTTETFPLLLWLDVPLLQNACVYLVRPCVRFHWWLWRWKWWGELWLETLPIQVNTRKLIRDYLRGKMIFYCCSICNFNFWLIRSTC